MSIDAYQIRHEIIRPVLKHLEPEIPYSMAAENLLMGTCAQESRMGQWITQLHDGPAKGIFQMEDATFEDIYSNFLGYRDDLDMKVTELSNDVVSFDGSLDSDEMVGNLYYAAAMCRVHYRRVQMALPDENDVVGMAEYWKNFYNTSLGKGSIDEFIRNYELLVA